MHWSIRPYKPKTYNVIFTIILTLLVLFTGYSLSLTDKDNYEFTGILVMVFAVGSIVVGCIAMAYWSIINKMDEWLNNGGE